MQQQTTRRPFVPSTAFTESFAGHMYKDSSLSATTKKQEKLERDKKLREANTIGADGVIVKKLSEKTPLKEGDSQTPGSSNSNFNTTPKNSTQSSPTSSDSTSQHSSLPANGSHISNSSMDELKTNSQPQSSGSTPTANKVGTMANKDPIETHKLVVDEQSARTETHKATKPPTEKKQLDKFTRVRPGSAPLSRIRNHTNPDVRKPKPWIPSGVGSSECPVTGKHRQSVRDHLVKKTCRYCHSQYYVREQIQKKPKRRGKRTQNSRKVAKPMQSHEEQHNVRNARAAIEWAQMRQAAIRKAKRIRNMRRMGYTMESYPDNAKFLGSPNLGNVTRPTHSTAMPLPSRPHSARPRPEVQSGHRQPVVKKNTNASRSPNRFVKNAIKLYSPKASPEHVRRPKSSVSRPRSAFPREQQPGMGQFDKQLRVRIPVKPRKAQRPKCARPETARPAFRSINVPKADGGISAEPIDVEGAREGVGGSKILDDEDFAISDDDDDDENEVDEIIAQRSFDRHQLDSGKPHPPIRTMTEFESIGADTVDGMSDLEEWQCQACNFGNSLDAVACVICGAAPKLVKAQGVEENEVDYENDFE